MNNRNNNSIDVSSHREAETNATLRSVIDSDARRFYINDLEGRKKNDRSINLTNVTKLKSVLHTFGSVIIEDCEG